MNHQEQFRRFDKHTITDRKIGKNSVTIVKCTTPIFTRKAIRSKICLNFMMPVSKIFGKIQSPLILFYFVLFLIGMQFTYFAPDPRFNLDWRAAKQR